MSMFNNIYIKNYKCFKDSNSLELAPLTILCGVNSSGKSSIINSLLTLKQSYDDISVTNSLKLNGPYVKNGTYADIINDCSAEKELIIGVSYDLERSAGFTSEEVSSSRYSISAYKNLARLYGTEEKIIHVDLSNTIAAHNSNGNTLSAQYIRISYDNFESVIEFVGNKKKNSYCIYAIQFPYEDKKINIRIDNAQCYFENFTFTSGYAKQYSTDIENINIGIVFSDLATICRSIMLLFKNLQYITPLRVYPQHAYVLDEESNTVGISGEYTPLMLKKYANRDVWFSEAPTSDALSLNMAKIKFKNVVNSWLTYIGLGNYTIKYADESLKINIDGHSISNVGFGASQALPILVGSILQSLDGCLILEQPEIHLHPRAQMNMADFLIASAMSKRELIVETHSDHIINRVIRRAMESPEINRNIKIYFIENGRSELVRIDPVIGAVIENENFFCQFATETEKIVTTGISNSMRQQE